MLNGYEGKIQVSNLGNVRSLDRIDRLSRLRKGNKLVLFKDLKGYLRVNLCNDGRKKSTLVHRLVAEAFIDNYNEKPFINHIDGNKTNNNVNNLEWVTNSENIKHAYKLGLKKPIRSRYQVIQYDKNGQFIKLWNCTKDIIKELNISHSSINLCLNGKRKTAKGYIWKYNT